MARVLSLDGIQYSRHAVSFRFGIAGLSFSTTLWYEAVDLQALAAAHSDEAVLRLLFHVVVFEGSKLCSLRPDRLELGEYARFWTPALEALWRAVFREVWAQWRFENDDPTYFGPEVAAGAVTTSEPLRARVESSAETLLFCGGGKDSLVALRLLERARVEFDTLGYASSIYGPAPLQHALIDGLVQRGASRRHFKMWIFDDFLDAPVLRLHPELGVRTLTAGETPSSIFAALPIALQHGHRRISLGHERSADQGQLRWGRTGEDINHQWGKSAAAEALLSSYIAEHLLAEFSYHSVLKPIYDLVIFGMLRRDLEDVPFTHSCNLRKPWCLRCPKCLYVWLGFAAFLPPDVLRATFGAEDLLADPGRVPGFRALLGIGGSQPFECIGRPEEVAIYMAACRARGLGGPGIVDESWDRSQSRALIDRFVDVDLAGSAIPPEILARIGPELAAGASETRAYLMGLLVEGRS